MLETSEKILLGALRIRVMSLQPVAEEYQEIPSDQ
jgi:hypothetical protein